MKPVIRENPEEELVRILNYATKWYRSDKSSENQGCINCDRHWLAIKQIVNQLGGFGLFKKQLLRGRVQERIKGVIGKEKS